LIFLFKKKTILFENKTLEKLTYKHIFKRFKLIELLEFDNKDNTYSMNKMYQHFKKIVILIVENLGLRPKEKWKNLWLFVFQNRLHYSLSRNGGLSKHIKGLKKINHAIFIFQNGICKSFSSNRDFY